MQKVKTKSLIYDFKQSVTAYNTLSLDFVFVGDSKVGNAANK